MKSKLPNTAILFVDLQNDFLERPGLLPEACALVVQAAFLLQASRALGLPVIHIQTAVSPDGSDAMPHWRTGRSLNCVKGSRGAAAPEALKPIGSEHIVHKSFYSGFESGELTGILQDLQVDEVVIAGLYTHACVRSTAMDAYAKGYQVTIALDAIASPEPLHAEVTRDFLEKRGIPFRESRAILEKITGALELKEPQHINIAPAAGSEAHTILPPSNLDPDTHIHRLPKTRSAFPEIASMTISHEVWQNLDIIDRAACLERWKNTLLDGQADWIHMIVHEVEKPLRDAEDEFLRSISSIATAIEVANMPAESGSGFKTHYRPVGTVAIITPWNNPMAIPVGKIAPALLYGNAVVWKPSPFAEQIAKKLLKSLMDAGLPAGLINLCYGDAETVRNIVRDPSVSAVTITGSYNTGRIIRALCNARGKPLQAELGGNNAVIVRPDTDLAAVMPGLVRAAFSFSGQRCTATRRFIVDRSIASSFISSFTAVVAKLIVGMPHDICSDLGPLISEQHAQSVDCKVRKAIRDGAKLLYAGSVPNSSYHQGRWYPPTVLLSEDNQADIVQQETFGPVAVIQLADDLHHALRLANDVRQGLVSGMIGGTTDEQALFLQSAQAGMLNIGSPILPLDLNAPFSGWKDSAIGIPEHGRWDRDFFSRVQAIYQKPV